MEHNTIFTNQIPVILRTHKVLPIVHLSAISRHFSAVHCSRYIGLVVECQTYKANNCSKLLANEPKKASNCKLLTYCKTFSDNLRCVAGDVKSYCTTTINLLCAQFPTLSKMSHVQ